jgi:hypothetical protein
MSYNATTTPTRQSTWLDVAVFAVAFLLGIGSYIVLKAGLGNRSQVLVTGALVGVMLLYAVVVMSVPRLRVRMDQAGDNSYYLGLLFTLTSMAFALYDFRTMTQGGASSAGVQQIISNFGIALATTIVGILLRVVLHQMRVDPADLEAVTRIELTEAAERLRTTLDSITNDVGRFHLEVRQRSNDLAAELVSAGSKTMTDLGQQASVAMTKLVVDTEAAHQEALTSTTALTQALTGVTNETLAAVVKLRAVEPPPLMLSRRLNNVATALEKVALESERMSEALSKAQQSSVRTTEVTERVATTLDTLTREAKDEHTRLTERLQKATTDFTESLTPLGASLRSVFKDLSDLENQSKRAADESVKAGQGSVEVLSQLTRLARGLTDVLKSS